MQQSKVAFKSGASQAASAAPHGRRPRPDPLQGHPRRFIQERTPVFAARGLFLACRTQHFVPLPAAQDRGCDLWTRARLVGSWI